ncbi:MAG: aromatic-ring-hydroxylating dioxygenase subunit beta [Acidimicrobiia bacterium]|nr:aromatic-ring-hydroxylating dioxygenase subunit beta [Acidimicrobiia bacterium]MDH5291036.1 aromatic-ring-hydroxylating dioxygenase subunit beta [Acidimicrobiia bacterium]
MTMGAWELTRAEAEDFLYDEADLLDGWDLEAWLALCTDDVVYEVPATGMPDGSPGTSLFLIHDDRFMLESRIKRLLSRNAHAENPRSRTRRLITNVRVAPVGSNGGGPEAEVRASFHVIRFRDDAMHHYVGRYTYRLRQVDGRLRIAHRRAALDADSLRHSGGKVSILL